MGRFTGASAKNQRSKTMWDNFSDRLHQNSLVLLSNHRRTFTSYHILIIMPIGYRSEENIDTCNRQGLSSHNEIFAKSLSL